MKTCETVIVENIFLTGDFFKEFKNWEEIFLNSCPLKVEVGCGKDDSLIERAKMEPQSNFIGIESDTGVARRLESKIRRSGVSNLRVIAFDGPHAVQHLFSPGSVHAFYIQFPDPWPKKRHAKRRIFRNEFMNVLHEKLITGGILFIATDVKETAELALSVVQNMRGFTNEAGDHIFCSQKPFSYMTLYERKFLKEGKRIYYLLFRKL